MMYNGVTIEEISHLYATSEIISPKCANCWAGEDLDE